ncbi:hypothetical protein NEMBOFW57_008236 [Staphylotrichum longicolle]|uniref:UVI-1 n=1 Tax=Staphylotrichum longicolle TaxID=669026 RepID=A0AAD4ERB1_9PEZI|nr:hypothetical protein NEMBOFW57_008236 [Staphylotrichum longicolle]
MVSLRSLVAGVALIAAPVMAALTPTQLADGIKILTTKSQALQAPAQSITILNAPLIVLGQGPFPQIITGFTDIVSTATVIISQLNGMPPVAAGPDSDLIFNAFREFVRVHQALLNILIGKAGIIEKVPVVGEPVASVLRSVESVVDTIAITLINNVQSRSADITADANSLGNSLDLCIQKYSSIVNL